MVLTFYHVEAFKVAPSLVGAAKKLLATFANGGLETHCLGSHRCLCQNSAKNLSVTLVVSEARQFERLYLYLYNQQAILASPFPPAVADPSKIKAGYAR